MKQKPIPKFYVICYNFNSKKMEPYDIMEYFIHEYKDTKKKDRPTTLADTKEFIKRESQYMFWARCEYEILLSAWPNMDNTVKWDVHRQVMMNIDLISELIYNYFNPTKPKTTKNGANSVQTK